MYNWRMILQDIRQIFIANKFDTNYEEIFNEMSTIIHALSKYPEEEVEKP